MNLLHIDSSILGEHSASRVLTRQIVEHLTTAHPGTKVTYRDLAAEPLPHYGADSLAAAKVAEAARDAATLEDFLAADTLVIGAPLYNFSLPSQLKAWIDRITIKGRTFAYSAAGPQGLAGGKRVVVVISRGGVYVPGAGTEFGEAYLKFLFGFLGIQNVTFVRAEGLNISAAQRASSLLSAYRAIGTLGALDAPAALAA